MLTQHTYSVWRWIRDQWLNGMHGAEKNQNIEQIGSNEMNERKPTRALLYLIFGFRFHKSELIAVSLCFDAIRSLC